MLAPFFLKQLDLRSVQITPLTQRLAWIKGNPLCDIACFKHFQCGHIEPRI